MSDADGEKREGIGLVSLNVEEEGKGVTVEVERPEDIYRFALEMRRDQMLFAELYHDKIKDGLVEATRLELHCYGNDDAEGERGRGIKIDRYFFQGFFHLAEEVFQRPDCGYYGLRRLEDIREKLELKGYVAHHKVGLSYLEVPVYSIAFSRGSREYELGFRFGSKQDDEEFIRRHIAKDRKVTPDTPDIVERLQHQYFPGPVSLESVSSDLDLNDEINFIASIGGFAKVYKDVVEILYAEAEIEPPKNRVVIFSTPAPIGDQVGPISG